MDLSDIEGRRTRALRAGLATIEEPGRELGQRSRRVAGADPLPSFDLVDHWSALGESDLHAERGGADADLSASESDLAVGVADFSFSEELDAVDSSARSLPFYSFEA